MQLLLCKTCTSFIKCSPYIIHQSQELQQQEPRQLCPSKIGLSRTTAGGKSQSGPLGVSLHACPICEETEKSMAAKTPSTPIPTSLLAAFGSH